MKISTPYLFDRASTLLSEVQSRMVKSQAQVASGKQVLKPSDEPDQAALIQRYKGLIARQENYQRNMDIVHTRLQAEATALTNSVDLLHRAKELTVQAANDTLSPSDRKAIAAELQGLRDQLLTLANSQDTNGNFIFGGSRVGAVPFAPSAEEPTGSPVYQGDRTRMAVLIGDRRSLPINRAGADVYARVLRDDGQGGQQSVGFFQSLDDLIEGVKSSSRTGMAHGNKELDAMLDSLSQAQADVGSDMTIITQQQDTIDDTLLVLKTNLSSAEDLDYAKAVTVMNKQMLSLEAAQSSFAKISQLNLFNFLR